MANLYRDVVILAKMIEVVTESSKEGHFVFEQAVETLSNTDSR